MNEQGDERAMDRAALLDLREKYRHLIALRQEKARDDAAGLPHRPSREALRSVAHRWPGALAELDRCAFALLRERLSTLDALLSDRAEQDAPAWVEGWIVAHRALRGLLTLKGLLRGIRVVDPEIRARIEEQIEATPFAADARGWLARLDAVASPPGGRLLGLVDEEVGRDLGIDPRSVRDLLMPRPTGRPVPAPT
jgi:hypothetical protein